MEKRDSVAERPKVNIPHVAAAQWRPRRIEERGTRPDRPSSVVAGGYAHVALQEGLKAREVSMRRELVEEARKELEADRAREYERLRASLEAERRELQASMEAEKRELRASTEAEWQKLRSVLELERQELRAALETERRELLASLVSEWQDMRASQEAEWLRLRASQEMEWQELRASQETERQRELGKTGGPLGPAHAAAESDIVQGVRMLNEEIFQTTKRAADDCHLGVREADLAAVDEEMMRSRLAKILRSYPPREDDATTLEIAIQAVIASDVARIISSWSAEPTLDQGFRHIYARMVRLESLFAVSRWRRLTRQYALSAESTAGEKDETPHIRSILHHVSSIFALSGAEQQSGTDLQESLGVIVRAALDIRKMIEKDIVTSEYEVYAEQPNRHFEPATMEDEYPPSGPRAGRAGAQIVCPARLGLRRLERGVDGTSEVVLIKPTVVLETVVDELAGGDQATGF